MGDARTQGLAAPLTYAEARSVSLDTLPGAGFRRLPFFRCGLTWERPDA